MSESVTARSAETTAGGEDACGSAGLLLLHGAADATNLHFLRGEEVRVGRSSDNHIVLVHDTISRHHAELTRCAEGWAVRDLGSRNGTRVNGRRIRAGIVPAGAVLRFGDWFFKLVEREAELHSVYLPDGTLRGAARRLGPHDSALRGGWRMDRTAADLARVAPGGLSVLLLGESGTGKEVAARELHRWSRRSGPFVAVNCAAIPAALLESELFGHRKGAFSGAVADKPGLFQAARGGTLLLDEIGDMPLELQSKLLRVLQTKSVTAVGAVEPELVDVRIVAATHRNLASLQQTGAFRQDLYARLAEVVIRLPPLRERKEDVLPLTAFFLQSFGAAHFELSVGFIAGLLAHDWPYNVRELEGCIRRALTFAEGPLLRRQHLPPELLQAIAALETQVPEEERRRTAPPRPSSEAPPGFAGDTPGEQELRALLAIHSGNISAMARDLGKARMQVHRWLAKYGLHPEPYRTATTAPFSERDPSSH